MSKTFKISGVYQDDLQVSDIAMPVSKEYSKKYKMVKPDERVIRKENIVIVYNYPLDLAVDFPHKRKGGWTRKALFAAIQKDYAKIYRDEDKAVGPTGHVPGMLNRDRSDGPYGIWGHDIGDLVVEGVTVSDKGKVTLRIGS